MLGATGFFHFTFIPTDGTMVSHRFSFAYKPPGPLSIGAIQDVLLQASKGPLVPDAVVFFCLEEDRDGELSKALRTPSGLIALERLEGRIPVLLAKMSLLTGRFSVSALGTSFTQTRRMALERALLESTDNWIKSGLKRAFPENDVVLHAPPGYAYQKPSGHRYHLFIKPELGLTTSAAVSFVASMLFRRTYCGKSHRLKDLQTIFVDTMAISNIAYGLRELMELVGYRPSFSIESFHSYGGFETIKRPLRGTSLCIISASSSMNLHRQWILEKRVNHEDVVTLLTFEEPSTNHADGALLALPRPKNGHSEGPPQLVVRIQGETFLPNQEPDKRVLLREAIHGCIPEVEIFCAFAGKGVFDIYRRPAAANTKARALFVDGQSLLIQEQFQAWLEQQLIRRVKASTKWIVYQRDSASQELAHYVESYCVGLLGLVIAGVIPSLDLESAPIRPEDGVLVCAAVVGKGSNLLEISRALREKHDGPRLYIVGFQVSEARTELDTLASNLRHDKLVSHDVAIFGRAAIGTQLLASYLSEKKHIYPPGTDSSALPRTMRDRVAALDETGAVGDLALLPHGMKLNQKLRIREGWAFWPSGYTASAFHAETLATVAVLLQRAREDKKVPLDERLASRTFQQVVLDPENFTRFNDGILQAALLRNAYPAELDYRADNAASDFMKAVILRGIRNATVEAGEGILEFLLAIATGRLQLFDMHHAEILAEVRNNSSLSNVTRNAMRHILYPLLDSETENSSPI